GKADYSRGRFGGARNDDALEDAGAAERGGEGDPPAGVLSADPASVLLWDRFSDEQGTDRARADGRADSRISGGGQPGVFVAGRDAGVRKGVAGVVLYGVLEWAI